MEKYVKKNFIFLEFLLLFMIMFLGVGCQNNIRDDAKGQSEMPISDINVVMEAHIEQLMALPGVVGVYIGALDDGRPCIKVMVIEKTPELEQKIPKALEGHPIVIEETGEIRPLSQSLN